MAQEKFESVAEYEQYLKDKVAGAKKPAPKKAPAKAVK